MSSAQYFDAKSRVKLEHQLEDAIKNVHSLTSQDLFDSERKKFLVDECNALRIALQDLLKSYPDNVNIILLEF